MTNKTDLIINDINMTEDEFYKHFTILLKSALNYAKLYAYYSYDEYFELNLRISSFNDDAMMRDEIKEEIKRYKKEMEYYKNLFKGLETLQDIEAITTNINEKFKVMKLFNELVNII